MLQRLEVLSRIIVNRLLMGPHFLVFTLVNWTILAGKHTLILKGFLDFLL